ncbi:MAG: hypothetical protein ABSB40_05480 [Nitrososphaeria archaeon]
MRLKLSSAVNEPYFFISWTASIVKTEFVTIAFNTVSVEIFELPATAI